MTWPSVLLFVADTVMAELLLLDIILAEPQRIGTVLFTIIGVLVNGGAANMLFEGDGAQHRRGPKAITRISHQGQRAARFDLYPPVAYPTVCQPGSHRAAAIGHALG